CRGSPTSFDSSDERLRRADRPATAAERGRRNSRAGRNSPPPQNGPNFAPVAAGPENRAANRSQTFPRPLILSLELKRGRRDKRGQARIIPSSPIPRCRYGSLTTVRPVP